MVSPLFRRLRGYPGMSQLVAALRGHMRAVEKAQRKVDTRRESSIEINPGAVPIQQRAGCPRLDTDGYSCVPLVCQLSRRGLISAQLAHNGSLLKSQSDQGVTAMSGTQHN